MQHALTAFALIAFLGLSLAGGGISAEKRAAGAAVPIWTAIEWGFVALSGLLHVGYFVVLLRGYRKPGLTGVYPLARGSGPLPPSLGHCSTRWPLCGS